MSCCGERRRLAVERHAPGLSRIEPASPGPEALRRENRAAVQLRCRGNGPLVLRGPVTGKSYFVATATAAIEVDARDATGLLATGQFTREPARG